MLFSQFTQLIIRQATRTPRDDSGSFRGSTGLIGGRWGDGGESATSVEESKSIGVALHLPQGVPRGRFGGTLHSPRCFTLLDHRAQRRRLTRRLKDRGATLIYANSEARRAIHVAHLFPTHSSSREIPCHFEGLTSMPRRHSSFINIQDARRSSPLC